MTYHITIMLSTVHCPLSTVFCPLSIVRCQLSAVHCPLSTVHCPMHTFSLDGLVQGVQMQVCRSIFLAHIKQVLTQNNVSLTMPSVTFLKSSTKFLYMLYADRHPHSTAHSYYISVPHKPGHQYKQYTEIHF
jgi:hypothetical protein